MNDTASTNDSGSVPDLVTTEWLAARPGSEGIVVLDASRHLPATERDARAEYEAAHIPGARFLDLASLTDADSEVPQALPRPDDLAQRLAALGVAAKAGIVLYDDSAIHTSARAWFMLTACGRKRVGILDGGLAKWRREGRPLESGAGTHTSEPAAALDPPARVATKGELLANLETTLETAREQVLDARSAERVFGSGEDPVHGGANGRIPGSLNLHYAELFEENGTYRSPGDLRAAFEAVGVDWDRPLVTTCGSGITASVLVFAAHLAGKDDVRLYDGSWMEWGADPAMPKAQGRP